MKYILLADYLDTNTNKRLLKKILKRISLKKIILVGNTSWSMIKFRMGLIKELINQKYDVIVVAPYDKYVEDIKRLGCKYINIDIDKSIKFLLIAIILWDKGVGEYVEVAKILKTKYKDVDFGLLGYLDVANSKAIIKVQMKEWENQSNIKFFGSTDDVKSFIEKSDCIVLPSYREGIGMTLMEA
jgi:glycosyltransferase involved in cell wall biosynthesis